MTDKEINLILGKHDLSMVVGKDREQIIAAIRDAVVAEREACAKMCEDAVHNATDWDSHYWDQACINRALAIRARGNT